MQVKRFTWNPGKNTKLKIERGVSFEQVRAKIESGAYFLKKNPSNNHKGQRIFIVVINGRVFAVPFTEYETHIFLRTIFEEQP